MDKTLYAAACEGSLILTVNDRLSRSLLQQYDQEQQRLGLTAWLRPEILSLSAWISRCQQLIPGMPLFLNKSQLQHIWETIVAEDVKRTGNHLLQIPQTARRAIQAYQLLVKYSAAFSIHEAAKDHKAFLRWRDQWLSLSDQNGWHDPVETTWLLSGFINESCVSLPGQMIFAGFDEVAPDLKHLCSCIEKQGTDVSFWQPQPFELVERRRVDAIDPADEVSLCARWIRELQRQNPAAKIGVVAPQLDAYQPLIEQHFTAELDPASLLSAGETPQLFNLSLGRGLDREGVVYAALRLLRVGMQVDHDEVSWLLRTPYVMKAIEEGAERAQVDRELRRLRRFDWSLPRLLRTLNGLPGNISSAAPGFSGLLEVLIADLKKPVKRLPGFWAEQFALLLQKAGWPGPRGLSSREFQAVQNFKGALGELASLDGVSVPMLRTEAAKALVRIVSEMEFQPEGTDTPIQVLGVLESSGLSFDHLWVLGLHDTAMPGSPDPNPFIPLPLQKRNQMKRSDAEREHLFARQVASRLFSAAPDIVLSWPAQEKGAALRPSPFIVDIPEGHPVLADSSAPARVIWQNRPCLEELSDSHGPPLSTRKAFTGGTGIIKDQALCPFRAFAHHRLRAEGLDTPDIGIDNMSRGTLAHTVLELFWARVVDQKTLLSLDSTALNSFLAEAVDGALDRLERERRYDLPARQRLVERQRLIVLVYRWLEVERRRGSFRVLAAEKSHQVKVGNLTIRTRIDRIDELEDGTSAIIDYKTGQTDPLQWMDDRVTEPQLPAYCLDLPSEKVGAVMFAVIRSKEKECGFRGLSRKGEAWPGAQSRALDARYEEMGWSSLDDIVAHWSRALPLLGDAFARGDAEVDPVDPDLSCKYCDLTGLCRIKEQQRISREGANE